ncbi:MAG: PadR family transcriptional regulator [Longimicrobiales bacterium]
MPNPRMDVLPGTLELIVLKTLSRGEAMHGFEVLRWIRDTTDGELLLEEGALYPALHRMERKRWLCGEWQISEKRRRARYYSLTVAGRAELVRGERRWLRYVDVWQKISIAATSV